MPGRTPSLALLGLVLSAGVAQAEAPVRIAELAVPAGRVHSVLVMRNADVPHGHVLLVALGQAAHLERRGPVGHDLGFTGHGR